MRQLNNKELEQISGGFLGAFNEIGSDIGSTIGGFFDQGAGLFGLQINATEAGTLLGSGIGKIFNLDLFAAVSDIGDGIGSVIDNSVSAIRQLFGL